MNKLFFVALVLGSALGKVLYESEFEQWAAKYGKTYSTAEERAARLEIFSDNLRKIAQKNAANSNTAFKATKFADLTEEEFAKTYLRRAPVSPAEIKKAGPVVRPTKVRTDLPDSFNWLDKGAVTSVKDQGNCGSCWSFGAAGCMEGAWYLAKGELIDLSTQNLVDCDHGCMYFPQYGQELCNNGCNGGMEPISFVYAIENGIMSDKDYPYTAMEDNCVFDPSKTVAQFSNWTFVDSDEEALQTYLYENGPVSVGACASEWSFYSGGVYTESCCTANNHAVLLTGWGVDENGIPYWIIKNSWDESWGIDGYIWLERGVNKCGVTDLMQMIFV